MKETVTMSKRRGLVGNDPGCVYVHTNVCLCLCIFMYGSLCPGVFTHEGGGLCTCVSPCI